MAITETFDTTMVGQREDLQDFIYNISPTETPLLTAAEWTTATATIHQWVEDELADVADNAAQEGATASTDRVTSGTQLANNTQISKKEYGVSGTAEVVTKAGRDSEIAYGRAKAMREIKRDIDFVIAGGPQDGAASYTKAASASSTAPRTAPLPCWVKNADRGPGSSTAGADPTGSGAFEGGQADTQADEVRDFTQSLLDNVIEDCWDDGGSPSLLVMGAAARKDFATFDGIGSSLTNNTTRTDRAEKTVYGTVDLYVSSFGIELRAVNSRNLRNESGVARDAWLIDPEHLKVAWLRPFEVQEFAKTGDSMEEGVLAEYALCVTNRNAHGLVADLG
mgnify:FL=1